MSDFNVRSDSVDVEQVMAQIRERIREKRGVDYTVQQLRDLAAVKLEKFLDPRGVRSDLLQRFKERQPSYEKPHLPVYIFEDTTIYETHRGPLQWIRRLLNPILKLLFNPNPIIHALHSQVQINALNLEREEAQEKRRLEMESLYYEIIHNLVFEMTRTGIEVKNLKMRVESLASRLEFNERRSRALESVVAYQPQGEPYVEPAARDAAPEWEAPAAPAAPAAAAPQAAPAGSPAEGPGQRSRRRRRRRGRRSGPPSSEIIGASHDGEAGGEVEDGPGDVDQPDAAAAPAEERATRTEAAEPHAPAADTAVPSGDESQ